MACSCCCTVTPIHYQNQIFISEILWHSLERNFTASFQVTVLYNELKVIILKTISASLRAQWVNQILLKQLDKEVLCIKEILDMSFDVLVLIHTYLEVLEPILDWYLNFKVIVNLFERIIKIKHYVCL